MTTIAGIEVDLDRDLPAADGELWYTRCPIPTAFEVALERGTLAGALGDAGLAWRQLAESADPAVHQSHFTHRQASSFRHGGNVPAIWARSRGADTRVIAVSWPQVSYPVLTLPGSGIATAADLAGRRLLVPRRPEVAIDFWRASTLRVYDAALRSAGLTFDDVELVERTGETHRIFDASTATDEGRARWALADRHGFTRAILEPLVRGEVDAVTAQGTLAEELRALLDARVVYEQVDEPDRAVRANNGTPDVLTVSGRLADEHPERVALVVGRLLEAAAWGREHPDEALRLFSERLQTPRALLELGYRTPIPAALELSLPDDTADVLRAQQAFLLEHGFIDAPFDVEDWIDPRPLELARAAA